MATVTVKQTTFRRSLALATACAALVVTTISVAAPATNQVPSIKVRYDDLNLATPAGVSALYKRISHAARNVCPDAYSRDLTMVAASEACQASAIARAVNEVNNPQLASLHAARLPHG